MENGYLVGFFSIPFDLIITHAPLPYNLYVNSSAIPFKERYVRIFPKNEQLSSSEREELKKKYPRLYVHENERVDYFRSIVGSNDLADVSKTQVLKDSAISYLHRLYDPANELNTQLLNATLSGCRDVIENMVDVLADYDVQELQKMITNLSFHDFYTYDHSINVAMYCISLFRTIRPEAPRSEVVSAGMGGLFHDLGKTKIETKIINKPDKLTIDEFEEIKKHPQYGFDLLTRSQCQCAGVNMEVVLKVVLEHHENYDGRGYPHKISGENIHLLARIASVADFFDAITTVRSYNEVLDVEDAIDLMSQSVGKKLDPTIFMAFQNNIQTLLQKAHFPFAIDSDFDPCQHHQHLPLHPLQQPSASPSSGEQLKKEQIKKGSMENFGRTKIIDQQKKPLNLGKTKKTMGQE